MYTHIYMYTNMYPAYIRLIYKCIHTYLNNTSKEDGRQTSLIHNIFSTMKDSIKNNQPKTRLYKNY